MPNFISQYSSPEGVFVESPVTFVGAAVFGRAAGEAFFLLLCAPTKVANSARPIKSVLLNMDDLQISACDFHLQANSLNLKSVEIERLDF